MRLFLASYRFGSFPHALQRLAGRGARVAVIANALDSIPAPVREAYARNVYDQLAVFTDLGLSAFDLDLRHFFDRRGGLAEALAGADLVWVTGGNSFVLRRAMQLSGFDATATPLIRSGALAYGGYSAGAIVACANLHTVEIMDPPDARGDGHPDTDVTWEGLGLIEPLIVPHHRSRHAESPAAERMADALQAAGRPFITLADADVAIMRGSDLEVLRG
jgi:dipeptidase E